MFIPRGENGEDCPPGHVSCTISIVGNSDSTSGLTNPDDTGTIPPDDYLRRPGAHRYIGIGMVVALAIVAVGLWMYYARYPRRHLARLFRTRTRSDHDTLANGGAKKGGGEDGDDGDVKVAVDSPVDDDGGAKPKRPTTSSSEKERARNLMLQSEPKGVLKEVSGGVVMFTEVPRAVRSRDRHPQSPVDWEFEHVHGVRFEVRRLLFPPFPDFCHSTIDGPLNDSMLIASCPICRLGHLLIRNRYRDLAASRTRAAQSREVGSKRSQRCRECHHQNYSSIECVMSFNLETLLQLSICTTISYSSS